VQDRLIWIDLEMTGLDPDRHVILEIATVITDDHLDLVAEGPDIAVSQPEEALSAMEEWSLTNHKRSGLLDQVKKSALDCPAAERETLEFLSRYCGKRESPLCGNSVGQDRRFLKRYMPTLEEFLHYRNIDVSSVKELVRRWYPSLPIYEKGKTHRALKDIKESINELRYYRQKVFLPQG
jgi:oligoribonuclease